MVDVDVVIRLLVVGSGIGIVGVGGETGILIITDGDSDGCGDDCIGIEVYGAGGRV